MQLGNEASVEDILASIKRVIARDAPLPAAAPTPPLAPAPIRDRQPDPEPIEPADAEEAGEVLALAEDAALSGAGPLAQPQPLTSDATDDALRGAFARLSAVAGLAQDGPAPLEDAVERALRPLLAQWLDAHLPALVERLVREEIARIAGPHG